MQFASANNPASDRSLRYVSGSGTETLLYRYVVQGNDTDATGLRLPAGQVERRGGVIKHATNGQPAILTHSGGGSNGNFPSHRVDGTIITPRASLAGLQQWDHAKSQFQFRNDKLHGRGGQHGWGHHGVGDA